jgi:hypothetical protein
MSRFNQGALEATYLAVKKEVNGVGYNDFHINIGQNSSIYYNNSSLNIRAERRLSVKELKEFVRKRRMDLGATQMLEGVFLRKLIDYASTSKIPIRSRSLDASLFLDSYGNVYPSIMWAHRIGNIRDTNYELDPIWHSTEANRVRAEIREGKEPSNWTSCEAYQAIIGDIPSFASLLSPIR